ncbi:MAG TPA: class I SAM-dependent methyltransferase, partial [Myxococcaceae bacterium]|nr:class I SAM-dependent methyltransferase [Myxococcaceae bacterium]
MHPTFNPLAHPLCLSVPRRLDAASGWNEHVPFALLLVELARPRTLVELGTRTGVSYCAFCQAVEALKLPASCYAVGEWPDAQHAELQTLRAHHDALYGGFSRLLVGVSGEAEQRFADGSVDLLHVSDPSTSESLRLLFEKWLPKMSRSGLVLL